MGRYGNIPNYEDNPKRTKQGSGEQARIINVCSWEQLHNSLNYRTDFRPSNWSWNFGPVWSWTGTDFTAENIYGKTDQTAIATEYIARNGIYLQPFNYNEAQVASLYWKDYHFAVSFSKKGVTPYSWYIYANDGTTIEASIHGYTLDVNMNDGSKDVSFRQFGWIITNDGTKDYVGFCVFGRNSEYDYYAMYLCLIPIDTLTRFLYDPVITEEYDDSPETGSPSTDGGYGGGTFDDTSDTIGLPDVPHLGVSTAGFINVYKISQNELEDLGEDLFSDVDIDFETEDEPPDDPLSRVAYYFKQFGKNFVNFGNLVLAGLRNYFSSKLVSYVIDCHIIPVTPNAEAPRRIDIGYKTFPQTAQPCTSDYVDVSCGTLSIGEYYQCFLDYVGTQAKLFLPFIGFVEIQADYFQNANLSVYYRFNIIDGSCIAYVVSRKGNLNSVIGIYSGSACVHIPITGENYSQIVSGYVQTLVNASPTSIMSMLDNMAGAPSMSNGYNASSAYMGNRYPYLVIERPIQNLPVNYFHTNGSPLFVFKKLSDIRGYTICVNVDCTSLNCDSEEQLEVKRLLETGVYL